MSDEMNKGTGDAGFDDRDYFEEGFRSPEPGEWTKLPEEWQSDNLIEVLTDMTDYGWNDLSLVGIVAREQLDSDEMYKTIASLQEIGAVTLVDGKSGMQIDASAYQAAARHLQSGQAYRYDREADETPLDWAHSAARGILHDLSDRGGLKHTLHDIDDECRVEIVQTLGDIVRAAFIRRAA